MVCRHCRTGNRCRPRGLCARCYRKLSIRDLYPPSGGPKQRRYTDPTPEEIEQRKAEIRREWGQTEPGDE